MAGQSGLLSAGRGLRISSVFHSQALLTEAKYLPAHVTQKLRHH